MGLTVKPAADCKFDCLSLGEVMLRLDPGDRRIRTTRRFDVWEGGGEYNVSRALKKCFGLRSAHVTAIVDNEVGLLLADLMAQGGVDTTHCKWVPFDGIGGVARNGLNFTERGFGIRPALGCSDRGHTAASQMKPGDIDWKKIFNEEGVRWFHSGGIFAALSATTSDVVIEAMEAARAAGTIVSYDLNFRASLWQSRGGKARAAQVNRKIAPLVDVMIGNEEDFTAALGFEVEGLDEDISTIDPENFKKMIVQAAAAYPSFKVVATTLRNARTATFNDWGAIVWAGDAFYLSPTRENLQIFDRVGGGDGFASGLAYALIAGKSYQEAVDYGAAHGALAMTTPGDASMATLKEVQAALSTQGDRMIR